MFHRKLELSTIKTQTAFVDAFGNLSVSSLLQITCTKPYFVESCSTSMQCSCRRFVCFLIMYLKLYYLATEVCLKIHEKYIRIYLYMAIGEVWSRESIIRAPQVVAIWVFHLVHDWKWKSKLSRHENISISVPAHTYILISHETLGDQLMRFW